MKKLLSAAILTLSSFHSIADISDYSRRDVAGVVTKIKNENTIVVKGAHSNDLYYFTLTLKDIHNPGRTPQKCKSRFLFKDKGVTLEDGRELFTSACGYLQRNLLGKTVDVELNETLPGKAHYLGYAIANNKVVNYQLIDEGFFQVDTRQHRQADLLLREAKARCAEKGQWRGFKEDNANRLKCDNHP